MIFVLFVFVFVLFKRPFAFALAFSFFKTFVFNEKDYPARSIFCSLTIFLYVFGGSKFANYTLLSSHFN